VPTCHEPAEQADGHNFCSANRESIPDLPMLQKLIPAAIDGSVDVQSCLLSLQMNASSQVARISDAKAQLSIHTLRPARTTHVKLDSWPAACLVLPIVRISRARRHAATRTSARDTPATAPAVMPKSQDTPTGQSIKTTGVTNTGCARCLERKVFSVARWSGGH